MRSAPPGRSPRPGSATRHLIDAFAREPPPPDHPLLHLPNVLLRPHSAGVSREAALRIAVASADDVLAAPAGRLDPAVLVNPAVMG